MVNTPTTPDEENPELGSAEPEGSTPEGDNVESDAKTPEGELAEKQSALKQTNKELDASHAAIQKLMKKGKKVLKGGSSEEKEAHLKELDEKNADLRKLSEKQGTLSTEIAELEAKLGITSDSKKERINKSRRQFVKQGLSAAGMVGGIAALGDMGYRLVEKLTEEEESVGDGRDKFADRRTASQRRMASGPEGSFKGRKTHRGGKPYIEGKPSRSGPEGCRGGSYQGPGKPSRRRKTKPSYRDPEGSRLGPGDRLGKR